ncbi:MAG: phosphomannose isomerase type II C-terminal cupin domain [Fulvivirga sp.]
MSDLNENIRPWGRYDILNEENDYKLKMILVEPEQRLSYQFHYKRDEYWIIIEGKAEVTLDNETHILSKGESITINRQRKHRVKNIGSSTLRFIEVQLGDYFGEDDIERLADDYHRS